MVARFVIAVAVLIAAGPSAAEQLNPDAARRFIVGKLFGFNCFDGSRGSGRIYGDGSVIGSVQLQGSGPIRNLWLPAGTLRVRRSAVCASVKGMLFEPCFDLNRTAASSFRGAVSGLGFAYCDFTQRSSGVANLSIRPRSSQPLSLHASAVVE
jgi:hypothetical protein